MRAAGLHALSPSPMSILPTEPLQITEPPPGAAATTCAATWSACRARTLKATLVEAGLEPFRARQVWQWIYWHGVTDFGR